MGLRLLGCCRRGRIRSRRRSYCVLHGTRREGRSVQDGLCTSSRPKARTAHRAILRLVSAPPSAGMVLAHLLRCAQAHVHLVGQRPAPRTSPLCALYLRLRLLGRLGGAAAAQRPGLIGRGWCGSGVAGWRMYAGGPEVRGPRSAFVWLGWFVVWEFSCSLMSFSRLIARMSPWRRTRRWRGLGSRSR